MPDRRCCRAGPGRLAAFGLAQRHVSHIHKQAPPHGLLVERAPTLIPGPRFHAQPWSLYLARFMRARSNPNDGDGEGEGPMPSPLLPPVAPPRYIVIGAGPAGCALAAALAEEQDGAVVLLEMGADLVGGSLCLRPLGGMPIC